MNELLKTTVSFFRDASLVPESKSFGFLTRPEGFHSPISSTVGTKDFAGIEPKDLDALFFTDVVIGGWMTDFRKVL